MNSKYNDLFLTICVVNYSKSVVFIGYNSFELKSTKFASNESLVFRSYNGFVPKSSHEMLTRILINIIILVGLVKINNYIIRCSTKLSIPLYIICTQKLHSKKKFIDKCVKLFICNFSKSCFK